MIGVEDREPKNEWNDQRPEVKISSCRGGGERN